jgi:hypothetical protein
VPSRRVTARTLTLDTVAGLVEVHAVYR